MNPGVLALLFLLGFLGAAQAQEPDRGSDRHIQQIIHQGLDGALQNQVQHLFTSWLKDDTGQPKRAEAGLRKAVRSYRHAIKAIETEQLSWKPTRKRRDVRLH